jgi:hypothetical protein
MLFGKIFQKTMLRFQKITMVETWLYLYLKSIKAASFEELYEWLRDEKESMTKRKSKISVNLVMELVKSLIKVKSKINKTKKVKVNNLVMVKAKTRRSR